MSFFLSLLDQQELKSENHVRLREKHHDKYKLEENVVAFLEELMSLLLLQATNQSVIPFNYWRYIFVL